MAPRWRPGSRSYARSPEGERSRSHAEGRGRGRLFRLEYLPAAAPGPLISFFLVARSTADITPAVIEGLVAVFLLVFAGLGINAIVDRDIDRKYATAKKNIPAALDVLGVGGAWRLIGLQIGLALVLTVHLSIVFDSLLPLAFVAAEALFGYGYSLPPLQFKVRGVAWHALSLTLATGLFP